MILTCPQCATRYQAEAGKFQPAGRKVRCARCGHLWHQDAPPAEPEVVLPEAVPMPQPPIAVAPSAPPQPQPPRQGYAPAPVVARAEPVVASSQRPSRWPMRLGIAAGWLLLAVVAAALVWTFVVFRAQVATLWPQSAALYSALGLKTGAAGLDIESYSSRRLSENGEPVLLVSGVVVNATAHELPVPSLRAALTDGDGRELYHWTFMAEAMTLGAGRRAPFHARLANPPRALRHVELRFAKEGE